MLGVSVAPVPGHEDLRSSAMIDFQNGTFVKLSPSNPQDLMAEIGPMLVAGEQVFLSFKGIRDSVVFTNKRLISLNVQGLTGKKRDYTSLPYSKIQAFSVETAGTFDLDAELELWFSGLGRVRLEFK
ncbi:PH domain-containing protein, partial [Paenibacillus sp. GCM10023250]